MMLFNFSSCVITLLMISLSFLRLGESHCSYFQYLFHSHLFVNWWRMYFRIVIVTLIHNLCSTCTHFIRPIYQFSHQRKTKNRLLILCPSTINGENNTNHMDMNHVIACKQKHSRNQKKKNEWTFEHKPALVWHEMRKIK